ncbi:MAG: hypothetical protein K2G70_03960 [Turicibacter sp.]|nr:hypothetical protein [Turicibacter sp.]
MEDKYNNIDEFIEEVEEIGLEISFKYSGKKYSITWSNNKLYIIECQVDDTLREYNNLYEALDDYIIEGLSLREVILKSNRLSY